MAIVKRVFPGVRIGKAISGSATETYGLRGSFGEAHRWFARLRLTTAALHQVATSGQHRPWLVSGRTLTT